MLNFSKSKKAVLGLFILIFFNGSLFSQQLYLPLGHNMNIRINENANKIQTSFNTGFKPLLKSEIIEFTDIDSVIYQHKREQDFFKDHKKGYIYRKAFFEDFIYVQKENFTLSINPLFYLEYGKQRDTSKTFTVNTRGIEVKGDIGKKVSFYSSFRENQAFFRPYVNDWAEERLVVPGQGAWKDFDGGAGRDFSMASAYVSFTPGKWVNIQLGHDKNFIGEGYRSLLLSDNSFNYPFLKLTFTHKGFKYVSMATQFDDFETKFYEYHTKKHGKFNYLSYSYKNRVEIGLFEGLICRTTDTASYVNKFPVNYFIPVIGVSSANYGFSSENKVVLGLNTKVKITDFIQIYGQVAIDNPADKQYALQGGFKIFDLLHSKLENHRLYLQAEINSASENVYTNDLKFQNWTHYNQELAHPLGNSFNEIIGIFNYQFLNLSLEAKYSDAELNSNGYSSDIYDNSENTENENISLKHKTLTVSWTFNPRTQLMLYSGIDIRTYGNQESKYIFFGLRTSLSNFYYDF